MADGLIVNVDAVNQTLRALRILRSNISYVFESLSEGLKPGSADETREKNFVADLQLGLQNTNVYLRELENAANNLVVPSGSPALSNSGLLSQDPAQDRAALYMQMIQSYRWTDKVREFAGHAATLLTQNSLKRSVIIAKRMRKTPQNSHNIPAQFVDNAIAALERLFPDMQIDVDRPYGTSSILQINIGKTLKAVIILRSLIIEWVVIKAFNEEILTEDGKVTDHANAAMLHYFAPLYPEVAVRSFMMWLHSYASLFTAPCHRCGNYLHEFLPPTWRDFRTLDAYHEACR